MNYLSGGAYFIENIIGNDLCMLIIKINKIEKILSIMGEKKYE